MAMTPEKKVKERVAKQLRSIGAYFFYPATGGYGRSGVPDIVGCYKGMFFGIECKAGKNKPTDLQEHELHRIRLAEGLALVVNEENMDKVADVLEYFVVEPWGADHIAKRNMMTGPDKFKCDTETSEAK